MPTENTDILPATTGLDLGNPTQLWDGFFRNVNVVGNLTAPAILTGNGNATMLQGRNLSAAAPANTQVVAWNSGLMQWEPQNQVGGGGGGGTTASFGYVSTAFSATPTFTPNPVGSCTFHIVLTADVTSSTLNTAGVSAGAQFTFMIVQDGVGNHAFAFPANVFGFIPFIGTSAGQATIQTFVFDGTNHYSISPGAIYP